MFQLICEGRCNPMIKSVDAMTARFQSAKTRNMPYDGTEAMLFAQRRLVYTDHFYIDGRYVQCVECKTQRKYGV